LLLLYFTGNGCFAKDDEETSHACEDLNANRSPVPLPCRTRPRDSTRPGTFPTHAPQIRTRHQSWLTARVATNSLGMSLSALVAAAVNARWQAQGQSRKDEYSESPRDCRLCWRAGEHRTSTSIAACLTCLSGVGKRAGKVLRRLHFRGRVLPKSAERHATSLQRTSRTSRRRVKQPAPAYPSRGCRGGGIQCIDRKGNVDGLIGRERSRDGRGLPCECDLRHAGLDVDGRGAEQQRSAASFSRGPRR
jgi:hypothetical protein